MTAYKSRVQEFTLQCIPPILCSVLVGFVFFQERVFDRNYGAFQFLWSAVVASVFYHLLVYARLRDALLGFILLFFLTLLTTGSTKAGYILRDIFYVGGIGLSFYVYFTYFRKVMIHGYAYTPFILAGIYGLVFIAASEIHLAIIRTLAMENTGGDVVSIASTTAFFGVLIGFAVGAGIVINEQFPRIKKTVQKIAA